MFVVKTNQVKALSLKEFEKEMVDHVKEFFPNHFIAMQEAGTRNTFQYAFLHAKKYGFYTQRNVCLYLNNVLTLGSNFDTDPQYPWAHEILNDKKENDPKHRIDKLSDKMLEVFEQFTGPNNIDINRALLNLQDNAADIFQEAMNSELKDVLPYLNTLYPKKFEVVSEHNLDQLSTLGKQKANSYNFTSEPNIVLFIVLMFIGGAGFDKDPQFPWASEILNDTKITDQNQRSRLLFDKAINHINVFLSQYKLQ